MTDSLPDPPAMLYPADLNVGIYALPDAGDEAQQRAQTLAHRLSLPLLNAETVFEMEMVLAVTPHRLELHWADPQEQAQTSKRKTTPLRPGQAITGQPIFADWSSLNVGRGAGLSMKQPIVKAVGLKSLHAPGPRVIDATAGWGEDAWLMASLGCTVVMVERCALLVALLQDAIAKAARYSPQTASRLSVVHADAIPWLTSHASQANAQVIHLDPMFPGQSNAAQRKPMRLLRRLVGEDGDTDALFTSAMASPVARVVVKRPPHAPSLGDVPPVARIEGKASRYDLYVKA